MECEVRRISSDSVRQATYPKIKDLAEKRGFSAKVCYKNVYIATPCGVWKVVWLEEYGYYRLMHHNWLRGERSLGEEYEFALHGEEWHFQRDKQKCFTIEEIVAYIRRHDGSKAVEESGIKNMPTRTRKQKLYKKHAEKRKRRRALAQVMKAFEEIETQHVLKKGEKV